ncbi:sensor histidine kinase [Streptodolium elevatio]
MLAADALDDIRSLAPDRPVSLTGPDGRPARPTEVLGDEPRLRQVVANLVANALRHTPDGTAVDLTVGLLPDGTALFEVRDHGDGLSETDAKRVFERFYRVDSSRSRGNGGGSGLGLAIVAALVQAHDGTVTADSGPGAAFRVLLPAPAPDPAASPTRTPG